VLLCTNCALAPFTLFPSASYAEQSLAQALLKSDILIVIKM